MNGLQIIKTLALKIRYASIVEWYNFWSIVLQHHQNIVPTVASIDETIRHITEETVPSADSETERCY